MVTREKVSRVTLQSAVGILCRLDTARVMVVGDMLLDVYTFGKAKRISPEAPVAVINVQSEEHRAGGAGNVILSLISLGANVVAVGRVGNDFGGDRLVNSLNKEGVDTNAVVRQANYTTPVKNRVIANGQQIVRVDYEEVSTLSEQEEKTIIEQLPALMQGVQVVAISDYGKGLLSRSLLAAIIGCAREHAIPVIADPKGIDFTKYSGATLIKPNLSEAFAAARVSEQTPLELVAKNIFDTTSIQHLMITRSEAGISLFDAKGRREDFPVQAREVKDVTGAGDTVLAMLSYSIANGLSYGEAIQLCNVAAGIAIEHVGCARVTLADVAERLLNLHNDNKIFDEDHLHALKRVLKDRQFALLHFSKEASLAGLSSQVFKTIRSLAATEGRELLISVDGLSADDPFVEMLASLSEVDLILLNKGDSYRSLPANELVVLKGQ